MRHVALLVRGLVAAMAVQLVACADSGSGSGGSSSASNGSTDTSTGTGSSCQSLGGRCFAVPAGFEGPVELHDDGATTCPNPSFEGGYAGDPFVAPLAECTCQCSSPNATCYIEGTAYDGLDCTGSSNTFDASPPFCRDTPDLGSPTLSVSFVATGEDTTYCASDQARAIRPPIQFDPKVTGCDASLGACDGGACVSNASTKLCVYSSTAHECPAGFDEKHTVIQVVDLDDTRDCGCLCGFPVSITCDPVVTLHTDGGCFVDIPPAQSGSCLSGQMGEAIPAVDSVDNAVADCSVLTPDPSGTVSVGGDGTLVCCTSA